MNKQELVVAMAAAADLTKVDAEKPLMLQQKQLQEPLNKEIV